MVDHIDVRRDEKGQDFANIALVYKKMVAA